MQYYTPDAVSVSNGNLVITTRKNSSYSVCHNIAGVSSIELKLKSIPKLNLGPWITLFGPDIHSCHSRVPMMYKDAKLYFVYMRLVTEQIQAFALIEI